MKRLPAGVRVLPATEGAVSLGETHHLWKARVEPNLTGGYKGGNKPHSAQKKFEADGVFWPSETSESVEQARQKAAVAALAHYLADTRLHLSLAPEYRTLWTQLVADNKQRKQAEQQREQQRAKQQARDARRRMLDERSAMAKYRRTEILFSDAAYRHIAAYLTEQRRQQPATALLDHHHHHPDKQAVLDQLVQLGFARDHAAAAVDHVAHSSSHNILDRCLRHICVEAIVAATPTILPSNFQPKSMLPSLMFDSSSSSTTSSTSSSTTSTSQSSSITSSTSQSSSITSSTSQSSSITSTTTLTVSESRLFRSVKPGEASKFAGFALELLCSGFEAGWLSTDMTGEREQVVRQVSMQHVTGLRAASEQADDSADCSDQRRDEVQLLQAMFADEIDIASDDRVRVEMTLPALAPFVRHAPVFKLDVLLPASYPQSPPLLLFYPADLSSIVPFCLLLELYRHCFAQQPGATVIWSLIDYIRNDDSFVATALQLHLDSSPSISQSISSPSISQSISSPSISQSISSPSISQSTFISQSSTTSQTRSSERTRKTRSGKTLLRPFAHNKQTSLELQAQLQQRQQSASYASIRQQRDSLPVVQTLGGTLLSQLDAHDAAVIAADTGSGKSSQVPQLLFEELVERGLGGGSVIICTQPRRLSATALAARVAYELQSDVGQLVGYAIRQESRRSAATRILFTTTGYLLRLIATSDPLLASTCTHLIIDEVHERSQEIDFLLALLRLELLPARNSSRCPLKLLLMSATADTARLSAYFGGCPVLSAAGRMFDVDEFHLEQLVELGGRFSYPLAQLRKTIARQQEHREDAQHHFDPGLFVQLVQYIHHTQPPGAILIFVPGAAHIARIAARLAALNNARLHVIGLHSSVSLAVQQEVFRTVAAPARKVVISTNICETSLTIPDVVYVIDSGRANVLGFDAARGVQLLQDRWIAKANARQRLGRAGRCQRGSCYRLYTRALYDAMPANEQPEILRTPLHLLCLQILLMGKQPRDFLPQMIEPPPPSLVDAALAMLVQVKAVDADAPQPRLTPLGCHLAMLPTDVHIGKLLIFASLLGCTEPMLSVAAFMTLPSPYRRRALTPAVSDSVDVLKTKKKNTDSDDDDDDDSDDDDDDDNNNNNDEKQNGVDVETARQTFRGGAKSDLLGLANMMGSYLELKTAAQRRDFCAQFGLSQLVLDDAKRSRAELARDLRQLGFAESNKHAQDSKVCSAVLCEALWPHVISVEHPPPKFRDSIAGAVEVAADPQAIVHRLSDGSRVFVHPQSMNYRESAFETNWLCYSELVHTSRPYVRDVNMVYPIAMLLFGPGFRVDYAAQELVVDEWIRFVARPSVGYLLLELRDSLQLYLRLKFDSPGSDLHLPVDDVVVRLIKSDGWL